MNALLDALQPAAESAATAAWLARPKGLLINNAWCDAQDGAQLAVEDPSRGCTIARVADAGAADVDRAVRAARAGFRKWSMLAPTQRARLLFRLADLIEQHAAEFAECEALDVGKPLAVARRVDVPFTAEVVRYNAGWATKLGGEAMDLAAQGGFQALALRQPLGVAAGIVPWNFPLLQSAMKLSAALAAGCAIVLKPSELAPLSALRLGELALEAGFPAGVVQVLTGGPATGAALVAHAGVDKVSFTGSTATGREIVRNCAADFKRVTLELGGKSPNIVFADADLEQAIAAAVNAAFFNTGQVCYAGTRLYVEHGVYERVLEAVAAAAGNLQVGPAFAPDTEVGPLVSARQLARVAQFVDEAVAEGARVVAGGAPLERSGYFHAPTVLADVRADMRVVREEVFGPVLCVQPFKNINDALAAANDSRFGLAAGVWSRDVKKAHRAARALQAGTVWINCYHVIDPHLPFGGWRESGWGREFGRAGVESFTELKSVAFKL